ncbi:MAG TPA: thioredoxin domain-containing protein [Saprospiraceae bacterium]|nr:thioredoxin domain-containing protein [Saprospiraceae bacterium]
MNHLQHETSPYLRQHKDNPVNWYAWKPEVLERARRENKPILVSVGYSTCHWCHVMERESFEDQEIADFMNEHFINIKVDREERPDLDQIFMEACVAISGGGGWPLNCFLTPDGRPYFAGTYYPPRPAHNRPSWLQLLMHMAKVFRDERDKVEAQAQKLAEIARGSGQVFFSDALSPEQEAQLFDEALIEGLQQKMMKTADLEEGGFGGAPKFPTTMSLEFLLHYHSLSGEEASKNHVSLSLEKMIRGGIYDQLGGGFARYATDKAWLVPHFEKMLYDNALLVGLIADYQLLEPRPLFRKALEETLTFVERELSHEEGGFYSALDADSEGVEGKFYVWDYGEVQEILGDAADLFCRFYDVSPSGNWEHTNILWCPQSIADFAKAEGLSEKELEAHLSKAKSQLLAERDKRIRPGLDYKILLAWNALMCTAYAKAARLTGQEAYRDRALKNISFLEANFRKSDGSWYRSGTYFDGQWRPQYEAFLEDYAFLAEAMLHIYELTFDTDWIRKAADLCERVIDNFFDSESNLYYFTAQQQTDIPLRRIDIMDNAIPSGNAVLYNVFQRMAVLSGDETYEERARKMALQVLKGVDRYPGSFARWSLGLLPQVYPHKEVAVVGEEAMAFAKKIQQLPLLHRLIMASTRDDNEFPLLADRPVRENTQIYVCENFTCQRPVDSVEAARALLGMS